MAETKERPAIVTDEHLEYLDDLRESGETNMFGAPKYLQAEFDVTFKEACTITSYWMATFSDRRAIAEKGTGCEAQK